MTDTSQPTTTPAEEAGATRRGPADLGTALRALRRRADLSQRDLAARSGVPKSTIGRIESGRAADPRFRTVERLVTAAGGVVTMELATGPAGPEVPAAPHDHLADSAGRRYPAHLDVRPVIHAADWWGAWWAHWYDLPRNRWPRSAPAHTYDLNRERRDRRRRRLASQIRVSEARIAQVVSDHPPGVWRWTATDPRTGRAVGRLGGFLRWRRRGGEQELVLCDLEVAPDWRQGGLGRRLIEALGTELARAGVASAGVLIDEPELPYGFFQACGFVRRGPQPLWLTLPAGG